MQRRPRRSGAPGTGGCGRPRPCSSRVSPGRQLLDDAGPLLAAADATRRRGQRAGRGAHHLVVGFRDGILVTPAVRAFSAERPEVAVEVHRLEWDDQEELILSGRVDVAYVRQPIRKRGLRLVPLFAERRLAALPADHPLAQRAGLSTADLAGERHLRYLQPAPVTGVSGPQRPLRSVEESSSTSRRDTPTRWAGQRLEDEAVRASTSRRVRANRFHVQHAAS
jgi:DNA-binding transcriptional LysR family regulator